MFKQFTKLTMIGLLACSFGVSACTESPVDENNPNNTTPDATPDTTPDPDMTEECTKTCEAPAPTCDGDTVKTSTSTLNAETCECDVVEADGEDCSASGKACMAGACVDTGPAPVAAPSCSDAMPPARCAEMPDAATWATSSVVSKLEIAGDASCCFDYNGDGEPDNGLGDLLGSVGMGILADANSGIADAIASGDIALVLEHLGLTAFEDGEFAIGFLLAQPATEGAAPKPEGGGEYLINPDSFVSGTSFPQAVAGATLEGTNVTAGPGDINLQISLLGIQLNLTITAARVTATVDTANSAIGDKGVKLDGGKLGGIIRIVDLFEAINDFSTENCGCLGLEGPLVTGYTMDSVGNPMCATEETGTCNDMTDNEGICITFVEDACTYLTAIPFAADINASNLGKDCLDPAEGLECDAVSVGIGLEAVGAKISGVAPAE